MLAIATSRPAPEERTDRCQQHGAFQAFRFGDKAWSSCPACEKDVALAEQRLRDSGLNGRFMRASFDSFVASTVDQRRVLKACRDYAASVSFTAWRPLLLIGPPGTGKSHLGAAIVRAVIEERTRAAGATTARDLIRELRGTWRKDSKDSEEDIIDFYGRAPLLLVDELGVGFGSDGELVQLLDVVDRRYQLERPTVFISNLSLPLLRTALGDRLFDRINESSRTLPCNWPTFRSPLE